MGEKIHITLYPMKEHAQIIASLAALALVLGTVIFLALHGMKDASLLVVLATAGAQVAYGIAGVKQQPPPPPAGSTTITATPGVATVTATQNQTDSAKGGNE